MTIFLYNKDLSIKKRDVSDVCVFTRDSICAIIARLCDSDVSVRLHVRLSDKRRYCA